MTREQTTRERFEADMKDFKDNVISTNEAAALLGTTQTHVELLIRREKILGKRLGPRNWVVYKPSVIEYRDKRTGKGRPPSNPTR